MKKIYYSFLILLLIPLSVFAIENPKILTLELENDNHRITYEGTTEDGSHAVMCKLYDASDKELDMLSSAVDNNKFEGIFDVSEDATYRVACANYEGGPIKSETVIIENKPVTYTVTFNTNGGSNIENVTVNENEKVEKPEDPTKEGYIFENWYEDETLTTIFDFNKEIKDNLTLYAGWNQNKPVTYIVSYNTNGGSQIDDEEVEKDKTIEKPEDPTKEGYTFLGWYEDETLTTPFNFETPITKNITIYANWEDKTREYEVSNKNGDSIKFKDEEGHEFALFMMNYYPLTESELEELEIEKEEYDEVTDKIIAATKKDGTLIALYEIIVSNEDDEEKSTGEFEIRIKMTDEMKKYNTFKIAYIKDDFTTEKAVELKKEGEYLVGKLPHLSTYAILGSNVSTNPNTMDNISTWISILIISIVGLGIITIIRYKAKNNN